LALNESRLGASDERDNGINRENKPGESARILVAPQKAEQDSLEHEQQRERHWQFLCENDIVECADGTRPKRVLYRGTVCGYEAGYRKGLSVEWSYKTNRYTYSVTVDTAIRLVTDVLQQHDSAARQHMREGGLDAAKRVRRGYAELLQELIEEQSPGQIASIWCATEHVFRRWEDEEIPIKGMKVPSLATLVSESESEMEDRIAKQDLQALLEAKQHRKVNPRKGQSLLRASSPAPAIGAVQPDPPSPGTNHPQPKIKEDIVSPRTKLRQEIAKQTAALEEEKRLRVQLGRVVTERESL
jgi:hypothetical protein